ncbi:serine/threonine-protein kinase SBK1-like [Pseudophryne corroboree]|uniref:serine/threonine-protein kinase SBK1-like n=1 Tax=Pseudophryne corroboree TaxID=495146 RepID=UPI0030817118
MKMEATQDYQIQSALEDDFQVLKHLGQGTYGEVVMARERGTGKTVALKLVRKNRSTQTAFFHELCVSIYLSSFEGIISTHPIFFNSADHYVLIQELAPAGSLHSLIKRGVGIPETMVKRCAVQLTRALEYMHSKALVHRDLKPDNVLLMDKECHHIKLSDFGLTQLAGTLVPFMSPIIPYMSPELCDLKQGEFLLLDASVDIWAFGVLLFVAFTGNYPWKRAVAEDPLFQEFISWQSAVQHIPPPTCWQKFSRKAQDLFHVLLSKDITNRNLVGIILNQFHFQWAVEEIPQETREVVVEEGNIEIIEYEGHIIVIEAPDEYIIVENLSEVDYIIVNYTSEDSLSNSSTSTFMLWTDNSSLDLGSEVQIV